jgi:hypothetical protein
MNVKFDLEKGSTKQNLYQSLIGSSAVLGLLIGSAFAGKIIVRGRRFTILLAIIIGNIIAFLI